MSRIGKRPVGIPSEVTVNVAGARVHVKGPKGELSTPVLKGTTVVVENGEAKVSAERLTRNPAFGTMRALVQNMVTGVTAGFSKTLEIVGTGYRAQMDGKKLVLQLGFSHPIVFDPPGDHDQGGEPDQAGGERGRQGPGGSGGGGHPGLPSPRALQGQGRPVRG